jgi:hypothetical protein
MLAGSFPAWLKRNADLQRSGFSMLLARFIHFIDARIDLL